MPDRIYITGAGVISAIGRDKDQSLRSLMEGRGGTGPLHILDASLKDYPCGEVPFTEGELRKMAGIPDDGITTRSALLGTIALKEAVLQAGLSAEDIGRAALISGSTVGGMDKSERYYLDFLSPRDRNTGYIKVHDCGSTTELIAGAVGGFSMATTLSTACSSAANAIIFGASLINAGLADIVAAGGTECLSNFHLNGFASLMILDTAPCRPFDHVRNGLNLGEGAAFVILESGSSAKRRGAKALARLSGWHNACDAFHQTATSENGDGPYLAMKGAIEMAGISPREIDYVNAHGTGTPNNDLTESRALKRVFAQKMPPVSSTKGFTGHTTSASGSIETVFCLLAMEHGFIPGNLGWTAPDPDCLTPVPPSGLKADLRHVLCNSFGFGGNDSALLLSRI